MTNKNEILEMIELDDSAKKVFLNMPRDEQILAIMGMMTYLREEFSKISKKQSKAELKFAEYIQEQREYRLLREQEEKKVGNLVHNLITGNKGSPSTKPLTEEELLSTTQKIAKAINSAFSSRFDRWINLTFGVLQTVITIIVLAVLYLAFGGQIPTP